MHNRRMHFFLTTRGGLHVGQRQRANQSLDQAPPQSLGALRRIPMNMLVGNETFDRVIASSLFRSQAASIGPSVPLVSQLLFPFLA